MLTLLYSNGFDFVFHMIIVLFFGEFLGFGINHLANFRRLLEHVSYYQKLNDPNKNSYFIYRNRAQSSKDMLCISERCVMFFNNF